jgi:hypothetical protein
LAFQVDEARSALEARGIDNATELLESCELDAIEGAITWWDHQQTLGRRVGPGLLAAKIREGGMPEYSGAERRVAPRRNHWAEYRRQYAGLIAQLDGEVTAEEVVGFGELLRGLGREVSADAIRAHIAQLRKSFDDFGKETAA